MSAIQFGLETAERQYRERVNLANGPPSRALRAGVVVIGCCNCAIFLYRCEQRGIESVHIHAKQLNGRVRNNGMGSPAPVPTLSYQQALEYLRARFGERNVRWEHPFAQAAIAIMDGYFRRVCLFEWQEAKYLAIHQMAFVDLLRNILPRDWPRPRNPQWTMD
jgi:hypothetical protein